MADSVGRSIRTVSRLGEVETLVEDVHGADDVEVAGRELDLKRPCSRKKSAMKSAWRCETQKAMVRVPLRFWSCS